MLGGSDGEHQVTPDLPDPELGENFQDGQKAGLVAGLASRLVTPRMKG